MEIISLKNVWFSYEDEFILRNVSFSINDGEFVCITGANGCGKSTLLRLILNLLTPNKGQIFLEGVPVSKAKSINKISYVSQKTTCFNPNFPATVEEIVRLGLYDSKFRRNTKLTKPLVENALCQVGMEGYGKTLIGKLSGGQQQRVFIAKALVNKPKLVFLDEPTSGIDSPMADAICCSLGDLNKRFGLTVLMITHDLNSIHHHANKILTFNMQGGIDSRN